MRPVEIVCHRGANEYAPENSYASSRLCIDWGVDYLEVDINTSKDGVLYLFHGPDLARTTNATGKIYDWNSRDLDRLECGSWFDPSFKNERIPRLEPFLEWVDHRVKLFFDVKWASLQQLRDVVYRYSIQDECFFWFGRDRFAHELHKLDDSLALKINVSRPRDVARALQQYGANIVEFSLANASPEMIRTCRELGVTSMILHRENDAGDYRRIIESGVGMVNCDHGDHFLTVLNSMLNSADGSHH
jgi:glycerophosphoryl diester phosphodiesterase